MHIRIGFAYTSNCLKKPAFFFELAHTSPLLEPGRFTFSGIDGIIYENPQKEVNEVRKKALKITYFLAALALCVTGLCACAPKSETASFFAMNTLMDITVYGADIQAAYDAQSIVNSLDRELSATSESSAVYAANTGEAARFTENGAELLSRAFDLCKETGGALDITVRPVMEAWGFTTDEYRVPGESELAELVKKVDFSAAAESFDGALLTLPEGMKIDLGAVAKGYAADRAVESLRAAGVEHAVLNLGGNVALVGANTKGEPWKVGVKDPFGKSSYVAVLSVADCNVVTSGGYERYFEENGMTYWHIIDPETGMPARTGLAAVTIVGESGVECDAFSTALFVMGEEKGLEFWRQIGGFEALFIRDDGTIVITEGLQGSFESSSDWEVAHREG